MTAYIAAPARRGDVIGGRYVLGDVLGAGGMGVVYSATQSPLERTVAIKLPRPELARDPLMMRRFRREAILGSRLQHRNIVRIFDFVTGDPTYLVMEHVAGQRLGELLDAHGPLALETAVDLVTQVLAALTECHRQGIVHGDVKTDNVLVETLRDETRLAKLFDFGLARFAAERASAFDRVVSGTPEYLAPEVVRGGPPTAASDIYACGVILYELIAGETPFAADSSNEILTRQLGALPVPLTWRCPDLALPAVLDDIIARTLHKEPRGRYASCGQLADALAAAVRDAPPTRACAAVPRTFSSNAPTRDMEPMPRRVKADVDGVVVAYLARARELVDRHRLASAISELEAGLAVVGDAAPAWRLQLSLAALYEGVGNQEAARRAAVDARARAAAHASDVGSARAGRFLVQLSRRMTRSPCYVSRR
jgi:serine/threonine protein kinase